MKIDAKNELDSEEVPGELEGITPQWCEMALQKADVIGPSITVTDVDVKRLVNEETGAADGGGMTAAQLVRIQLTYEGVTDSYTPPSSFVAKCMFSGKTMTSDLPIHYRLMIALMYGRNVDEDMWRRDIKFYREALPLVEETYAHPRVYYTGIIDGGNRGFFHEVVRPAEHRIRTIAIMQDMEGWRSQMLGANFLNFDETVAILQNVAVLHGNFWGDRNKKEKEKFSSPAVSESEIRPSNLSKMAAGARRRFLRCPSNIVKTTTKMLKQWDSHEWFRFSADDLVPSWLKSDSPNDSNEDGIFILKDRNVLEMLKVYSERYPAFSAEFTESFLKTPSQTLLHGDFHNGNHMYLEENGKLKVVAFDFQGVGHGLAVSDISRLFAFSKRHTSCLEDMELLGKYHEALVLSGVGEYSYEDIKQHFIIAVLETLTKKLMDYSRMNEEQMLKFLKGFFGEEKFVDLKRMFDKSLDCNSFIFLTSLYLKDKDKFLNGAQFFDVI